MGGRRFIGVVFDCVYAWVGTYGMGMKDEGRRYDLFWCMICRCYYAGFVRLVG